MEYKRNKLDFVITPEVARLRRNRRRRGHGGGGYLGVINDTHTKAWFVADDLTTVTKDGADRVSDWADKLGSGRDLEQATGADQPLWSSTGILFDGVSEFMKCATFTYEQPEMVYIVFKTVAWGTSDRVFEGHVANSGALVMYQNTPELIALAPTLSPVNANLAVGSFGIVRVLFNGVTSTLQINNTTVSNGDWGAADMSGFTLARQGTAASQFSNIEVKEIILRDKVDTSADQTILYNYLANKYSI